MRRSRVLARLASSTQQMNSLRANGVMSFQASSAVASAINASRRSAGNSCTTPPGTPLTLTDPSTPTRVSACKQPHCPVTARARRGRDPGGDDLDADQPRPLRFAAGVRAVATPDRQQPRARLGAGARASRGGSRGWWRHRRARRAATRGLLEALTALPPDQRAVVVLRHVAGYGTDEIARMLKVRRGTVGSRLRRGLDRLRSEMEEDRWMTSELIERLEALRAPAGEARRERAVRTVAARVRAAVSARDRTSSADRWRLRMARLGGRRSLLLAASARPVDRCGRSSCSPHGGGPDRPGRGLRRRPRPLRRIDAAATARRARAGGSRTSPRTERPRRHRRGRWNSSPASRSPTNRIRKISGSVETGQTRVGDVPARGAPAPGRTLAGVTTASRKRSRSPIEGSHPHGQQLDRAPGPRNDRLRRHAGRVLRQPGRPRQPPDDRALVRRRLRARTEGRGPRPGRLRRTARLADQGRLADLARSDAGEGRQSRRPRRRCPRNAEGDPGAQDLRAVTGPRRRPHHRPLPGGRPGDRHRLLPLVPAVGRGSHGAGTAAAATEAERAMATSRHWPGRQYVAGPGRAGLRSLRLRSCRARSARREQP